MLQDAWIWLYEEHPALFVVVAALAFILIRFALVRWVVSM